MRVACFIFGLFVTVLVSSVFGHGWSEEMKRELNAPPPDWLSIGVPIKAGPLSEAAADDIEYRPVSGDSKSTRDRVKIMGRDIEIRVDYPINWYRGSSLSPDGERLIVNSGAESKVYKIFPDNDYQEIDIRLPRVTYDAAPKGFITGWSWADNETLIGEAEIDNEKGEFIERRIYVYYLEENLLSSIDLSALNLATTEGLTVVEVGRDLDRLRISLGEGNFEVAVDLQTLPAIAENELPESNLSGGVPDEATVPVDGNRNDGSDDTNSERPLATTEPASLPPSSIWPYVVVAVAVVGIVVVLLRAWRRNSSR